MATTTQLENQIKELKAGRTMNQLKTESIKTFYKVQNLSYELSYSKAFDKGNLLTKEHLTGYKSLIIFLLKKSNFNGCLDLKEAMSEMLLHIEKNKVVFITEKGIKGIISTLALDFGIGNSYKNLIEKYEIDLLRQSTLNCGILKDFQQFKLSVLA